MNRSQFMSDVLPSMLAGIGRHPLSQKVIEDLSVAPDPKVVLKALSLTGQALRFCRPIPPPHFLEEAVIKDDRTIFPDDLRRPLLRLLAGKTATEHPSLALARDFDRLRLRPHPFDLPRIDVFVRAHAEQLGLTAQHWARRQSNVADEPASYFHLEALDETNWTQAAPKRRVAYLGERRRQDAVAARLLVEATWPQENAEMRLQLLQVMQIGLGTADQPFLTSLEKDRAPRVRLLAQRLLSRISPGSQSPALRACLERISRTETGLLRKRPALALELPATVKEQGAPRWIHETFSEVSFEELTAALSLSEVEMINASAKDTNFLLALALIATADRRLDLLETIVSPHLPNAWELMFDCGLTDLGMMTREERLHWAEILVRPYGHMPPRAYPAWGWLHHLLDGPAPASLLDPVIKTTWLNELPAIEKQGPFWMEVIAALCPSPQRRTLRERLNALDSSFTATALPLLDILDAMEKIRNHV